MANKTQIVGILNRTPDSFYRPFESLNLEKDVLRVLDFFKQGASIVDIGGESTRPPVSVTRVSEEEEIKRTIPFIKELRKHTQKPLSIDTYKVKTAELALEAGVNMLNDISGGQQDEMIKLAAEANVPIVISHIPWPIIDQLHQAYSYSQPIIIEVKEFFEKKLLHFSNLGLKKEQIILDPGIGFGKGVEGDFHILANIRILKSLGFPLYVGISRKSFQQKTINKTADQVLHTTLALNTILMIDHHIEYLRVHDVEEHYDVITVINKLQENSLKEKNNKAFL